jgi:xylan 1,4-beta-xylosidase
MVNSVSKPFAFALKMSVLSEISNQSKGETMIQSSKTAVAFLAILAAVLIVSPVFAARYTITVNSNTRQGTVPHFWSRCVGTGGAQLCLDANWKAHAKIGVAEAGFQAFRGHRILTASNPITWNGSGTPTYNWTAFDRIYDFLIDSLNTVPVMELSSMPPALQTNGEWSPPRNYDIWQDMINKLVAHCITRYGRDIVRTWFFEVWNEWDYSGFWNGGTEQNYYQLYKSAVAGAVAADPQILIGGPSTTGSYSSRLANFLNFCRQNSLKVDFVSNHCYGGGGSGSSANAVNLRDDNRTRSNDIHNFGQPLVSMNTEFNSSYQGQGGATGANCISMDSHVNAPFVAKCVKLILDDHTSGTAQVPGVFSYWAISDVFDEGSWYASHSTTLFGQVFGLINQHGIRKATFNAFKMLHMMGTTRLQFTGGTGTNDGVDGFATVNSNGSEAAVMVYNFYSALAGQTAVDTVNLTVNNLPLPTGTVEVRHYRVDSLHSNPYAVWLRLGRPASTNTSAMDQIRTASNLAEMYTVKTINYSGAAYTETFTLPRQGVSLLIFKSNNVGIAGNTPLLAARPALSLKGTTLHLAGVRERPVEVTVFSLDGQTIKFLTISREICDLRHYLPKGVFIVSVRGGGQHFIGKIAVDR